MADYKSILKGTINSVTKKAKDYVESGGLKDAYDKGSTAARCYANIAKLTLQINGELEEQNKVFIEIGRLCYDENRDNPGESYAPLFDELNTPSFTTLRRTAAMSEALGNLLERRSIRAYKPEQISEDELQSVLKAGLLAPSAMNRQPTAMLVVQDKDTIALLSKLNAKVMGKDIDPFYGAPTVIVVLADRNVPTYIEDGALVLGNLMNAANAIGLGSCWVNRAKEVFEMPEAREILRKAGIGNEYIGIGHCILGYVCGDKPAAHPTRDGRVFRI